MHPQETGKPSHRRCRFVIDVEVRPAGGTDCPRKVTPQGGNRGAACQIVRGEARLQLRGLLLVSAVRSKQIEQFACLLVSHREWR